MSDQIDVSEFYMEKRGSLPPIDLAYRIDDEEAREVAEAVEDLRNGITDAKRAHLAKELADRMFTGYGVAEVLGINLDRAFALVCASNMTKEPTDDGKIQKGPGYVAPDMYSVLDYRESNIDRKSVV